MPTPRYEEILRFDNRSFSIRHDSVHYSMEPAYHIHPEMELAVLRNGGGMRTVNGTTESFGSLDIAFIPSDMPHCWTFDPLECPSDGIIDDSCCQFAPSLLTELPLLYREFRGMAEFFKSLRQAIQITGDTARFIADAFPRLRTMPEPRQVLTILDIFLKIYESREFRVIGMPLTGNAREIRTNSRLHLINRIISEEYAGKITLGGVAAAVGMSPTAFCNAFKAMTGTTFNRYLTDYRMRIAARLLHETDLNIGEISYRVGYADGAHFTRAFTEFYKTTPTAFRSKNGS